MDKEFEIKVRKNFDEALSKFDFETVHDVMEHLDWTWWIANGVPSKEKMIAMISGELFENAIKSFHNSDIYVGSGGFYVRIYQSGVVEIQFVVRRSAHGELS